MANINLERFLRHVMCACVLTDPFLDIGFIFSEFFSDVGTNVAEFFFNVLNYEVSRKGSLFSLQNGLLNDVNVRLKIDLMRSLQCVNVTNGKLL